MKLAIPLTDSTFDAHIEATQVPVLIDFWADWCGPCKSIAPIVNEVAGAHADDLSVVQVDVDANPALAQRFGIMSVPTLVMLRRGELVLQLTGARSRKHLEDEIAPHLH